MLGGSGRSGQAGSGAWGVFLALGWEGHGFGLSQLMVGCQEGKRGSALSPAAFLPLAPAGWGPSSPHPFSHQCVPMPGWHSHPPARTPASAASSCQPEPPVLSQHPHGRAQLGGYEAGFGQSSGSCSPVSHSSSNSCHQVRGLVPEPCQPLQPCPCFGTPDIQGLSLGAPLHPQSGLRARHSPRTWVTLLPDATSQGWEWHRLPSHPACPAKGPGDPLPKPPRWVQAG